MPKVKAKSKRNLKLTHNECRLRACIWCGKKKSPGSLQSIGQKNLHLIQNHGNTCLDPATDDYLPKVICTSCRLGLRALDSPNGGRNNLPPLFSWRYEIYSLLIASYELM